MENRELIIEFLKYCVDEFEKIPTELRTMSKTKAIGFCSLSLKFYFDKKIKLAERKELIDFIVLEIFPMRTRGVSADYYYFNNASERLEVAKKLLKEMEGENGE